MKDWKYHCSILEISESATEKDIRRAYRRLALERHPDKHGNSAESTLDFQQLHESYEFLLDNDRPAPAPKTRVDHDAPTDPGLRAPPRRRAIAPVREPFQWKMWLQMTGAAAVLLVISIAVELAGSHEPVARTRGSRELAANSSCLITVDPKHESFDYTTESACHAKCETTTNATCSWSSVVFRGQKADAPVSATPSPPAPAGEVVCQVTAEHSAGKPETTSYQHQTEASCAKTCFSKADLEPRAGIRCVAGGKELFARARFVPPPETDSRAATEAMQVENMNDGVKIRANSLGTTCYLSSISQDGVDSNVFPGDTMNGCQARCQKIIAEHPLDHEVRCSYAGMEIVTYVPDGTLALLSRSPAEGGDSTCEIYGSRGDARISVRAMASDRARCESGCRAELAKAARGTSIQCTFAGKEFLRQDVP